MTDLTTRQRLILEGAYNVRDIGGYPTRDGGQTRWRTLLRSDSLHALTPAAQRALLDYGVRTMIDLRRPAEITHEPNVFATAGDVDYRSLPLYDDANARIVDRQANSLDELYLRYLDMCQPQLRAIMGVLADPDSGPTLVHCRVGKDRTGLTIALALAVAGVPDETIIADYALSAGYLQPLFEHWISAGRAAGRDTSRLELFLPSPPTSMANALAHLHAQYGGIEPYLRLIGLSATEVGTLRTKLVE